MAEQSNRAIYASIAANVVIATSKLIAAAFTGSSAMIAEGVHSAVDAGDGALLLLGRRRSQRPADEQHPFGHGKELYFWTLIVAVIFFAVGGGVSVYEGILHLVHPEPAGDPTWNYVVLGIALVFDGYSFSVAWRELHRVAPGRGVFQVIREGKDPSIFTVVLEDTADLTGILLAFLGVFLGRALDNPYLDGVASIGIGLVMATVAVVLAAQSRGLLIGERASPEVLDAVRAAAADEQGVESIGRPLSMQLGPGEVLLAMDVRFARGLSGDDVADVVDRLEARIRERRGDVRHIYLEARSLARERADAGGAEATDETPSEPQAEPPTDRA